MRIFLVGYMGTGKSTLGRKIAFALNKPFVDTDSYLEGKLNTSISEFFEKHGELEFRKEEHKALHEIIDENVDVIVSTGGGMPCYLNSMDVMNASGTTIFLDLPEGMIVHRLKNGKQNRPLLKNKNLAEFVKEHLAERKPFYMKSKITVDADWLSRHNVSDLIKMIDQLK